MKAKFFLFLFLLFASNFVNSTVNNVYDPIKKIRPPKLTYPICSGKEYFTLDKLEITEEGIFVHLDEKTLKLTAIYHDKNGFFYLKKCQNIIPKPFFPCEEKMLIRKKN